MKQSIDTLRQRGQSLVEFALFAPIFILLMVGVVEVSQLVITQNRVSNAARVGTRFGSNGGQNDGIAIVALNSVTQTMEINTGVWDIWAIRGTVNQLGDGFEPDSWQFEHIYGISQTNRFTSVQSLDIQANVLEELRTDQTGAGGQGSIAAGLRVVGTYILHDVDSFISKTFLPSVNALSIMRVVGNNVEDTIGCSAFPLVVDQGIRSITAADYPLSGFEHPANPPLYASYTGHVENQPLNDTAKEGYLYRFNLGQYAWLVWNLGIANNGTTLGNSLTWPGNSNDYTNHGDGGPFGDYGYTVRGYLEPGDHTDDTLHIEDGVKRSASGIGVVTPQLRNHVDTERTLRFVVGNLGLGDPVHAQGFATFRILGFNSGGGWILTELISWDTSCGRPIAPQ